MLRSIYNLADFESSVGKSSVLENFVGRDFLPRGTGIVTRRPLILQLINGPNEYGEFVHIDNKEFVDFKEIRAEIQAETDRGAGTNKGISNIPIRLRIHSPKVTNLTLVDLPGITRVPVGDQPSDIGIQIRKMILEYISKDTCLILAVSQATVGLANSDAIDLAREVDPDGKRTIGVITHVDLMNPGTDARDIFDGKILPLKHGYVGVVNRTQADIDFNTDISTAIENERDFFLKHKSYQDIAHRLGTPYLQKVLNKKLLEHIRDCLPDLRERLISQMSIYGDDIAKYEQTYPSDPLAKKKLLIDLIIQVQMNFKREIGSLDSNFVETDRLTSGAKIERIFHERLLNDFENIHLHEGKAIIDTKFAIQNLYGILVSMYPPYKAFEVITQKEITKLEVPFKNAIQSIIEELSLAVSMSTKHLKAYPKFHENIQNHISSFIHENRQRFQQNVLSLIQMQRAYMNTKHEEFDMNHAKSPNRATLPEDEVVRKGILEIQMKNGVSRSYYLYLRPKALTCVPHIYGGNVEPHGNPLRTNDEFGAIIKLPLDGLQIRNGTIDSRPSNNIYLFRTNGENVYQDNKELKLSCESADELLFWYESFACVLNGTKKTKDKKTSPLERDIEDICKKVESYMRIVKKTTHDMFPKAVTFYIIRELEEFINTDLLTTVSTADNGEYMGMLMIDEKYAEKYKIMKKKYDAYKDALSIIRMC